MQFECRCGKILSNSANPEIEYRIYSDDEWCDIVSNESMVNPILIPYPKHTVWVCPDCKRAYVFEAGSVDVKDVYVMKECNVKDESKKSLHNIFKIHKK